MKQVISGLPKNIQDKIVKGIQDAVEKGIVAIVDQAMSDCCGAGAASAS